MKYMLLIYGNAATWDALAEQGYPELMRAHAELISELSRTGELIATEGLTTVGARTVRVHNGVPAVTDGPFTEAKEVLAGYYLLDCANIERATDIAARIPEARLSPVEVRPLKDMAPLRAGPAE